MTTQDADDTDREASDDDGAEDAGQSTESSSDAGSPVEEETESIEDELSEIAEPPDAEVDSVLGAIAGDGAVTESDAEETQETDADLDARIDPESVTVEERLVSEVEAADAETIARAIALLRAEVDELQTELEAASERADDFESRLKRKQADFQNYKKRQEQKLEDEKQRATEDLVERLLDVRDNLARALDQNEDADIRSGVESTLEQFDQQLDRENVESIAPEPGESTDPTRHEVLATVDSDQPEDTIAAVHRPGYEMAGKVLRPAQVTVSDGTADEE